RQHDPAVLIDLGVNRLRVDQPLQRAALRTVGGQPRDLVIKLRRARDGIALDAIAARHAVDQHEVGGEALGPVRVALLKRAAKGGRDRHAALLVHLVDRFAPETPYPRLVLLSCPLSCKWRAVLPESTTRHPVP